jgi:hypothetical protein
MSIRPLKSLPDAPDGPPRGSRHSWYTTAAKACSPAHDWATEAASEGRSVRTSGAELADRRVRSGQKGPAHGSAESALCAECLIAALLGRSLSVIARSEGDTAWEEVGSTPSPPELRRYRYPRRSILGRFCTYLGRPPVPARDVVPGSRNAGLPQRRRAHAARPGDLGDSPGGRMAR